MIAEDVRYSHDGTQMLGRFFAPDGAAGLPAILVLHGAHGLDGFILSVCERLQAQGLAVLAADLWGGRLQLRDPAGIGAQLGRFAADRACWMGRIEAARQALIARQEVDATRTAVLGYCFGGAGALEFLRIGGDMRAAVSFHGGLDLVADDWSAARQGAEILICSGSLDPMARAEDLDRICAGMTAAGLAWEADLYGGVKHAFTEPDQPGRPPFARYDARADRRSWVAMTELLSHIFA